MNLAPTEQTCGADASPGGSPHATPASDPWPFNEWGSSPALAPYPRDKFALYSKGGMAYGFRTENAYIEGLPAPGGPSGAFFLAAAMFADTEGTVNDDAYDYAAVADPLLADVAETLARAVLKGPPPTRGRWPPRPAWDADSSVTRASAPTTCSSPSDGWDP